MLPVVSISSRPDYKRKKTCEIWCDELNFVLLKSIYLFSLALSSTQNHSLLHLPISNHPFLTLSNPSTLSLHPTQAALLASLRAITRNAWTRPGSVTALTTAGTTPTKRSVVSRWRSLVFLDDTLFQLIGHETLLTKLLLGMCNFAWWTLVHCDS